MFLEDFKEESLTAVFALQELINYIWNHIAVFGKEVLVRLARLATQIVEVAIYLQCHSSLARSTATTLTPLLNRHSALCAEFGVSAIYGDTHHNRFSPLLPSRVWRMKKFTEKVLFCIIL